MTDNTQLVHLSSEMELDAQSVPLEAAAVVEDMTPTPNRADTTEREYLLKMALEVYRMRRYEPIIYIIAVIVAISSIITPFIVTRHLPPPGRATSITVTGNGVSSITTSGGGYTVIVTNGANGNISFTTTGNSTGADIKQKNVERKARQERMAAERAEKKAQKEARKLERQAEKLRRKAERLQ